MSAFLTRSLNAEKTGNVSALMPRNLSILVSMILSSVM